MDTPSAPAPSSAPSTSASTPAPAAKSAPGPDSFTTSNSTKEQVSGGETPQAKAARKLQLKVDGKMEEVDVDGMSDEALGLELQMAKAARKRMQEAAEQKKQFGAVFDALKKGDWSMLKDPSIGIDIRKMVEDQLIQEYEAKQLPPEEQQKRDYEKQLQERDAKLKEYETKESEKARMELEATTIKEIESDFSTALESKDLPRTRETMALMAEVAATYLEKHGIQLTPQQLASEVEIRIQNQAKFVLSRLKGDALVKYLGQETVDSLVKHTVEKYRATANTPKQAAPRVEKLPEGASSLFDDDESPKAVRRSAAIKDFAKLKRGF